MNKTQIERITKMEAILDESAAITRDVAEVLERFSAIQDKINELSQYYGSAEWLADYDDSNSGKLPAGMKCGVLSEDSIYDLLAENKALAIEMLKVATKILK